VTVADDSMGVGCLAFLVAALFWLWWNKCGFGFGEEVELAFARNASLSASARRRAKRVSLSSAVASMVEGKTSSALRCSFSLSPAMSSAKSAAKV